MTNEELDNYMKIVNPNFDSHIEKGTIEMSNEYYNLLEEKMARLINQNQELKKQVEELYKKLFITKNLLDMREKSIDNKLTQQKEFINYLENEIDICDSFLDTIKSDLQETPYGVISANKDITTRIKENETAHKIYEEILQKYKEIIGDDK